MKLFLDTSLFKCYHQEERTIELDNFLLQNKVSHLFLSEIPKVEFSSTVWKKVRINKFTTTQAQKFLQLFKLDAVKYIFIPTDSLIIEQEKNLASKYGIKGLRSLDSIQLPTCIALQQRVDAFYTNDNLLKNLLETEGLPTKI